MKQKSMKNWYSAPFLFVCIRSHTNNSPIIRSIFPSFQALFPFPLTATNKVKQHEVNEIFQHIYVGKKKSAWDCG